MEFFLEMDIPAMDMASDVCRVVLAGIILFSHVGSLTVGKLVDKIQFCSKWYCDHKQLFDITQIQLSVVRFQILAKSLPVCGLHVPRKTLTWLICPLPSPFLEQQTQQFRNVLQ